MTDISVFQEFLPIVDVLHEQVFTPPRPTSIPRYDLGSNEKQLESWLAAQRLTQAQLSVEEEVRKCLEAVHLTVSEIVLDAVPTPPHT